MDLAGNDRADSSDSASDTAVAIQFRALGKGSAFDRPPPTLDVGYKQT